MNVLPDLQSSILCDDVRQERNGKFIYIGIFDVVSAPRLPIRHPRLFVVNRWCSGDGEFQQKTRILAPDEESAIVEGKDISFKLPNPHATVTNVEVFFNTLLQSQGTYWVEILLNANLKMRYPIQVRKVEAPAQQIPPQPGPA